eukprot:1148415-Prymnesium_polylepis.1
MTCHPGALNNLNTPSSQLKPRERGRGRVVRARLGRAARIARMSEITAHAQSSEMLEGASRRHSRCCGGAAALASS